MTIREIIIEERKHRGSFTPAREIYDFLLSRGLQGDIGEGNDGLYNVYIQEVRQALELLEKRIGEKNENMVCDLDYRAW